MWKVNRRPTTYAKMMVKPHIAFGKVSYGRQVMAKFTLPLANWANKKDLNYIHSYDVTDSIFLKKYINTDN